MKINEKTYTLIKDEKNAFEKEIVEQKLTDYYYNFDYVVGDWAYGKLRLKGFYDKKSKNCKSYNDYSKVDTYIQERCAFGCRYFILKKVENE